jgi:hypothetical protein
MLPGPLDSVDGAAIARLLTNGVAESRTLEYKRDLPDPRDKESKREFLADVTSFANAQGGDLLFGIDAPKGLPVAIPGLALEDPDGELLRWEAILQDGVEPRLPGLRLRWIQLEGERGVLLIRMPPSPIAPHRVTFSNSSRFYGRRSNAKYEMDTQELREAFTASEALPARMRALHLAAVEAARRGELPIGLGEDPRAIVSVIPLTALRETRELEITPENALAPVKPSGYMDAIEMIEGVLLHTHPGEAGGVRSYAITYRQGRTDTAWTIGRVVDELSKREMRIVWPKRFEDGLLDCVCSTVSKLQPFGIEGPWVVLVTLIGIRDYHLRVNEESLSDPAWRDEVTLPSLRVDIINRAALLPLLRAFWLAFGLRRPASPFGE